MLSQNNYFNIFSGGCTDGISYYRHGSCWWGCAEPVNIASINRKADVPSGRIRGISINNLICTGEGSIYIAGKEDAPITDITLNNIRHTLEKNTEYPIKGYDFRPCCGSDFYEGKINGIYVKNAENVFAQNLHVTVKDEMKQWVDKEICFENVREYE